MMAGDQSVAFEVDYYISYTAPDEAWAAWVAWLLDASGYRVTVQVWNVAPGAHPVDAIREGASRAGSVIAVISNTYLDAIYGELESQVALTVDQIRYKILPIYVEDSLRPTIMDRKVGIDLFDLTEDAARERLLRAARMMGDWRGGETVSPSVARHSHSASPSTPGYSWIPPFPGDDADHEIDPNEVVISALLSAPAIKRRRRFLANITYAAFQSLRPPRPPRPPDRRELEAASNARWARLEERLDRRLARAGPPSDEHRQPPSTNQPEDPR